MSNEISTISARIIAAKDALEKERGDCGNKLEEKYKSAFEKSQGKLRKYCLKSFDAAIRADILSTALHGLKTTKFRVNDTIVICPGIMVDRDVRREIIKAMQDKLIAEGYEVADNVSYGNSITISWK